MTGFPLWRAGRMVLPDLSGGNAEPVILEPCGPGNLKAYWMLG